MASRLILILSGALAFWFPVVLYEVLAGYTSNIVVENVLPLALSPCTYWVLRKRYGNLKAPSIYMLIGMYVFCPLSVTAASFAYRGRFHIPFTGSDALWVIVSSIFPPLTLLWAGGIGAIFALLPITAIFILLAVPKGLGDN